MRCSELRAASSASRTVGWNFLTCWWLDSYLAPFSFRTLSRTKLPFSRGQTRSWRVSCSCWLSVVKRYQISREQREELLYMTGQGDLPLLHQWPNEGLLSWITPWITRKKVACLAEEWSNWWTADKCKLLEVLIDGRFVTRRRNNDSKSPIIGRLGFDFLEYANESGGKHTARRKGKGQKDDAAVHFSFVFV